MNIFFRTDSSTQIGTGHVARCLTLAELLQKNGANCRFICREHEGNLIEQIQQCNFLVSVLPAGVNKNISCTTANNKNSDYKSWLGVDWKTDAELTKSIIKKPENEFELKFIRYCNIHKILLYNGPKITYNFNDKNLTYKIDFCIPKLKLLIEIKDNHVWHREQISSGKWESKLKGVNKYILETDTYNNYIVIYPKNYVELTEKIVRDYWND